MLKNICFAFMAMLFSFEINATPSPYITSTSNQQLVANQLETISHESHAESDILKHLATLPLPTIQKVLSQMTGQQYTTLFTSTEIINRQFIRRLYDPLRPLISNPNSYEDEVYDLCSADGIDAWTEGSVNRSFLDGDKNTEGFKMSGYELSIGAQKRLDPLWTFGFGVCYAIDHFHYNVGGSGKTNTVLGAVYTLYRPANYYILADVTFGYATNDMHRRIKLDKEHDYILQSRPNISEVSFYGEAGIDWAFDDLLLQPFFGFEANRFKRSCIHEHGHKDLELIYSGKTITNAYSRLGFHLTLPENCYDLSFAFDLAWQYRLTSCRNHLNVRFDDYGTPFDIAGVPDERNSMSMGFTVWSELIDGWTLYLEASGERWKRVSNYDLTCGLIFKW